MELRLRTRTPSARLNSAGDLYGLSNDQYFLLNYWHSKVYGRWAETYANDLTDADWPAFRDLVHGLDTAISVLNYLLADPDQPEPELLLAIHDWAIAVAERDSNPTTYVLSQLADDLLELGWKSTQSSAGRPRTKLLNDLVEYERRPVRPAGDPSRFDLFISYKHRLYAPLAQELAHELRARGLECWFDADQIDTLALGADYAESVKSWLRAALRHSSCAVFFAAVLEATVDQNVQGHHLAFNWQAFEQHNAPALLYVYPDPSGTSGRLYTEAPDQAPRQWGSIAELAGQISEQIRNGVPSRPARDEPDLEAAAEQLLQHGKRYGAALQSVTPLAELALLAPPASTQGRPVSGPTDEDVLLALLRYHPETADRLVVAGLDIEALFEAGAREPSGRWSAPHRFRWPDVFGHDTHGLPYKQELPAIVTEQALLKGLTPGLVARGSTEFVARSLRNRHAGWTQDRLRQELTEIADRILTEPDGCRHGRHAWLVTDDGGRRTARPMSSAGVYRAEIDGLPVELAVYVSLPMALFSEQCSASVGDALDSRLPGRLESVYREHPEAARTMTGAVQPTTVWLRRTPNDELIVLADRPAAQACAESSGAPLVPATLLKDLDAPAARPSHYRPASFLHLDGPLPAHIVADPCARAPSEDGSLGAFELIATVLAPLERYLSKRSASYEA